MSNNRFLHDVQELTNSINNYLLSVENREVDAANDECDKMTDLSNSLIDQLAKGMDGYYPNLYATLHELMSSASLMTKKVNELFPNEGAFPGMSKRIDDAIKKIENYKKNKNE